MTKRLLSLLAVVVALAPAAPARAWTPTFAGDLCTFSASQGPTMDTWDGVLSGGPLAVAGLPTMLPAAEEDLFANPVTVSLSCTLGLDGIATVATTSGTGEVVVVAPPTPFSYVADDPMYFEMCSAVTVTPLGGPTERYYWDYAANRFSVDPAAPCYISSWACPESDPCSGPDLIEYVDLLVCPKFALLFPPDGDIEGLWDCPPYGD